MRPRVSVYIATSLDNFIARDDGSLDWLEDVQDAGGGDYGYAAFMDTIDAVVLGRTTYDAVRSFDTWPFTGKRVIVVTNRPLVSAFGEEAYAGALTPLMQRLGADGVQRVYLDGGATIRQGLDESLVDDMTLSVVPVLLGSGLPLFTRGLPGTKWTLTGAEAFPKGLVQLRYDRA
ncbi:MAG TPA: dihydrofolate reductase family protein [Gemmatimonadaceae bacterium]|nr:dihydrofolate reductase family protein [Gemmatimonadaceae bacterium]